MRERTLLLLTLGCLLAAGAVVGPGRWQKLGRWAYPHTYRLAAPSTCGVHVGSWDDAGFVGFVKTPIAVECKREEQTVTCVLQTEKQIRFVGTVAQRGDVSIISALGLGSPDDRLELTCDGKGSCDFARTWNIRLDAGTACVSNAQLRLDGGAI